MNGDFLRRLGIIFRLLPPESMPSTSKAPERASARRVGAWIVSALPFLIIGGLLYASLFVKPKPVGASVKPPAIERRDKFFGVAVPEPGMVWAVGDSGKIVASSDGGRSFHIQHTPVTAHLQAIAAWDARRAVVVGNQGVVLLTADGGQSWVEIKAPQSAVANKLMRARIADDAVWAVGEMGAVLRSVDHGKTWERMRGEEDVAWNDIAFVGSAGWIVGEFGRILRSSDGGVTWSSVPSPVKTSLTGVAFHDEVRGVAVGLEGVMLVTGDGGQHWKQAVGVTREHLFAVTWDGLGWVAVGDKGVLVSGDAGGASWKAERFSDRNTAWYTDVVQRDDRLFFAGAGLAVRQQGKFHPLGGAPQ